MDRLTTTKYAAAGTILLPMTAVVLWPSLLWIHALFIGWVMAVSIWWVHTERKVQQTRTSRMIHTLQTTAIQTLNHHRHDWMNDLQVLYGYIKLNKQDRIVEYVEKIRERMLMESKLSKLGVPSLVAYFQSFRTLTNTMRLDIQVDGDIVLEEVTSESNEIAEILIELVNAYRFAVKPMGGEAAVLKLQLSRNGSTLQAAFYYQGDLHDEEQFAQQIKQRLKDAPLRPLSMDRLREELLLKTEIGA